MKMAMNHLGARIRKPVSSESLLVTTHLRLVQLGGIHGSGSWFWSIQMRTFRIGNRVFLPVIWYIVMCL